MPQVGAAWHGAATAVHAAVPHRRPQSSLRARAANHKMDEIKRHTRELQERLADLHAAFSQTTATAEVGSRSAVQGLLQSNADVETLVSDSHSHKLETATLFLQCRKTHQKGPCIGSVSGASRHVP